MDQDTSSEIIASLKDLINQINPKVRYVSKYGGEVLALDPNSDTKFVGGIFCYKDHVSLEFSQGTSLNDPGGILEGTGKARRHIKFKTGEDVIAKSAKSFLTEVLAT